ncbi:MAK10-like protein [Tanacetum coccineum]
MENENPIRTLGDYSRPSHEGYRNTIELPDGNNVVPLRSDTIRMDSFQGLTPKVPHHGIDLWLQVQIFYDHVNPATMRTIDQAAGGEMTNKIDTFLKSINDRMTGALPSDTVNNPKLNVNSTSSVFSARSYLVEDPQCSLHSLHLINAIKTCSKQTSNLQKDQLQTVVKIRTSIPKKPKKSLEDEFKDLHLNLPVLKVLAHAPMYNAIMDKYVESIELGKNGSAFIQGKMPEKIKDPELFTLPCSLGDSNPFDTLADLGSYETKSYPVGIVKNVEVHIGRLKLLDDFYVIDMKKDPATPLLAGRGFLATANAVIDCRKGKIAVGEGVTRCPTPYYAKKDFTDYHLPGEWEIARDVELNPFKDVLESEELIENRIDWNKPPKGGDGAWHAKIRLIDPDGEEFTKTFQSIPTTRKLSEKENPSEIIDLDHFHDS